MPFNGWDYREIRSEHDNYEPRSIALGYCIYISLTCMHSPLLTCSAAFPVASSSTVDCSTVTAIFGSRIILYNYHQHRNLRIYTTYIATIFQSHFLDKSESQAFVYCNIRRKLATLKITTQPTLISLRSTTSHEMSTICVICLTRAPPIPFP